jgi:hypothetical protein
MLPRNKLCVKVNQAVVEPVGTSAVVSLSCHRTGKRAAEVGFNAIVGLFSGFELFPFRQESRPTPPRRIEPVEITSRYPLQGASQTQAVRRLIDSMTPILIATPTSKEQLPC